MGSEVQVEVVDGGVRLRAEMVESTPGSGLWGARTVAVSRPDGAVLGATALRDLPWSRLLGLADVQARATAKPRRLLGQPSDPPAAFRQDRRGQPPRTDADYAALADAYLYLGRRARKVWAARFGGSERTWSNRITEARRRFIVTSNGEDVLTEAGWRLLHGNGWAAQVRAEQDEDATLSRLRQIVSSDPDTSSWSRTVRKNGGDPLRQQNRARSQLALLDPDFASSQSGGTS